MTGPVIPVDQWPEGADRHCWDDDGQGYFYGPAAPAKYMWRPLAQWSDIPMPAGWDWRVPVMRPSAEESSALAPAIDLEQFRGLLAFVRDGCKNGPIMQARARELLALIDGQANVRSCSEHWPADPEDDDLPWCSLCGLRFVSERALSEHRHVVDEDSGCEEETDDD